RASGSESLYNTFFVIKAFGWPMAWPLCCPIFLVDLLRAAGGVLAHLFVAEFTGYAFLPVGGEVGPPAKRPLEFGRVELLKRGEPLDVTGCPVKRGRTRHRDRLFGPLLSRQVGEVK